MSSNDFFAKLQQSDIAHDAKLAEEIKNAPPPCPEKANRSTKISKQPYIACGCCPIESLDLNALCEPFLGQCFDVIFSPIRSCCETSRGFGRAFCMALSGFMGDLSEDMKTVMEENECSTEDEEVDFVAKSSKLKAPNNDCDQRKAVSTETIYVSEPTNNISSPPRAKNVEIDSDVGLRQRRIQNSTNLHVSSTPHTNTNVNDDNVVGLDWSNDDDDNQELCVSSTNLHVSSTPQTNTNLINNDAVENDDDPGPLNGSFGHGDENDSLPHSASSPSSPIAEPISPNNYELHNATPTGYPTSHKSSPGKSGNTSNESINTVSSPCRSGNNVNTMNGSLDSTLSPIHFQDSNSDDEEQQLGQHEEEIEWMVYTVPETAKIKNPKWKEFIQHVFRHINDGENWGWGTCTNLFRSFCNQYEGSSPKYNGWNESRKVSIKEKRTRDIRIKKATSEVSKKIKKHFEARKKANDYFFLGRAYELGYPYKNIKIDARQAMEHYRAASVSNEDKTIRTEACNHYRRMKALL